MNERKVRLDERNYYVSSIFWNVILDKLFSKKEA